MSSYTLVEGVYLYPTPSGVFHATSSPETDSSRHFLRLLLQQKQLPQMDLNCLQELMDTDDEKNLQLLYHCQKHGWVQGVDKALQYPQEPLGEILPGLLNNISHQGKVLLADKHGLYLACSGFSQEEAEELAALSAEIALVQERRSGLLAKNLGLGNNAWSVVDAAGNSQVGFWPVYIGTYRFVIVISGVPHFNQPEFVSLVWALSVRYAKSAVA